MNENAYYDIVAQELQAQKMVPGLWTRAFSEAGGQLDRARALYIKLRVAQLAQESTEKLRQERRAGAAAAKKRRVDGLRRFFLVVLSIALGLFASLLFVVGISMQFGARPEPIGSTITCLIMAVVFGFFTYLSAKTADSPVETMFDVRCPVCGFIGKMRESNMTEKIECPKCKRVFLAATARV